MRRFAKSFCYAFCGVVSCLKTERNMRVHFCAAFYVFMFMPFYGFTAAEKAVILLTIGSVISAEAFNTAAEAAADAVTLEKRPELRLRTRRRAECSSQLYSRRRWALCSFGT